MDKKQKGGAFQEAFRGAPDLGLVTSGSSSAASTYFVFVRQGASITAYPAEMMYGFKAPLAPRCGREGRGGNDSCTVSGAMPR